MQHEFVEQSSGPVAKAPLGMEHKVGIVKQLSMLRNGINHQIPVDVHCIQPLNNLIIRIGAVEKFTVMLIHVGDGNVDVG